MMKRSKTILALLIAGMVMPHLSGTLSAKASKELLGKPQGPIYNPKTDTYYELRNDNFEKIANGHHHSEWKFANRRANSLTHKGRKGRLAVVKDQETLEWLDENFAFWNITWIGLRFFCKFRKLVWVNGEIQPLKSPGMWAPQWHRSEIKCSTNEMDYMPVYLTTQNTPRLAWQASGWAKYGTEYLVEYPALPKNEKAEDAKTN